MSDKLVESVTPKALVANDVVHPPVNKGATAEKLQQQLEETLGS
jgi:hypothetical protein